ncbi:hypothetical protein CXG81DRAFT_4133, partial [Caulochytrium protostelioides]
LLQACDLDLPPGRVLAVLGSSGSGKTTLLAALAGRHAGLRLTGDVRFNGTRPQPWVDRGHVAYVGQDDVLLPHLTVRETLQYAARLRGARRRGPDRAVMQQLGLTACADLRIGDGHHKGLSGGQRRRVSVAVQLLTRPSLLLADEITTGLDAATSLALMETLRGLCQTTGMTLIVTMHQPRTRIVALLDAVLVLAKGRTLFSGPCAAVMPYFADLGFVCPAATNAADWLVDLASVDTRTPAASRATRRRVLALVGAWHTPRRYAAWPAPPGSSTATTAVAAAAAAADGHHLPVATAAMATAVMTPWWSQVATLTHRRVITLLRNRLTLLGGIGMAVLTGIVYGAIFYQLGETLEGVNGRRSFLYISVSILNYMTLVYFTYELTLELRLVDRERQDRMYHVAPAMAAWWLSHLAYIVLVVTLTAAIMYGMIGLRSGASHFGVYLAVQLLTAAASITIAWVSASIFRHFAQASVVSNFIFLICSMSSGFFVPLYRIPVYMRWINVIDYIRWGYTLVMINEFHGHRYACPASTPTGACDGDQVLATIGITDLSSWPGWTGVALHIIIYTLVAYLILIPMATVAAPPAAANMAAVAAAPGAPRDTACAAPRLVTGLAAADGAAHAVLPAAAAAPGDRLLLDHVCATFRPGTLNVVLGSSGSGKSTLLTEMMQRSFRRSGAVLYNGRRLDADSVAATCAFVSQEDHHLLPGLTARETLCFAAEARLRGLLRREQHARAARVLRALGLSDCSETLVGGLHVKGLSGGERRRLSIGVQMLTEPSVLLVDEPTSGLDAFVSASVLHLLAGIAHHGGRTVICSLHQPRSEVWPLFDHVLLLAEGGRPVYAGPGAGLAPYLAQTLATPLPPLTNPADWALDVSTVDRRDAAAAAITADRLAALLRAWSARETAREAAPPSPRQEGGAAAAVRTDPAAATTTAIATARERPALTLVQATGLLMRRDWQNVRRQGDLVSTRMAQLLAMAVVFMLYFIRFRHDQPAILSMLGFLQQTGSYIFIGTLNCLALYPQMRNQFRSEWPERLFTASALFWAYTLTELPFELIGSLLVAVINVYAVGFTAHGGNLFIVWLCIALLVNLGESIGLIFCSLVMEVGVSVQIISVLIIVPSVMAGFLSVNMPVFLDRINYVSVLRWTARVLSSALFRGLTFTCTDGERATGQCTWTTGDAVLRFLGFETHIGRDLAIAIAITVAHRALAWAVMAARWR